MTKKVSDIHELAVLIGFSGEVKRTDGIFKKSKILQFFISKYSKGKIKITEEDIKKHEKLFDRGLDLAKMIQNRYGLPGETLRLV